jgi:hypothetical protein
MTRRQYYSVAGRANEYPLPSPRMRNAIDQYAEAIRLDPAYKRRASIQRDLIIALSSDKTANRATQVLQKSIGNPAIPALRKASKRDTNPVIRKRAETIMKRIQLR